jgi:integrase
MTEEEKLPKERKRRPRGHGEGSIFYRRDRKQWVAQISLENGRTRQVYCKKREEAADALQEMLYEQKQGILATGAKQTLGHCLEFWLENVQKPAIRINHYINTRTILNLHILPALGRVQLQQLTAQQVQSLYAQKLSEGKSAKTIHHIHGILHKALAQATRWRLVARNVCDVVELPRLRRYEYQTLTKEQAQRLLEAAKGHRFEVLLALALTTGMRHGELLGLHWQDINFDNGTLQVRRSVSRVRGQGYKEFEPKTTGGMRMLTLPQFILEMLKEHRTHQEEAQRAGAIAWRDQGLVFCNRYGS